VTSGSKHRKKDIKKKIIVLVLCAMLFGLSYSAAAQHQGKIFRIGVLNGGTASNYSGLLEGFRQELSKLGWVEKKNITFEYRFAEQKNERPA
jgi:ABC-type sugar transport system substrate-binding protein